MIIALRRGLSCRDSSASVTRCWLPQHTVAGLFLQLLGKESRCSSRLSSGYTLRRLRAVAMSPLMLRLPAVLPRHVWNIVAEGQLTIAICGGGLALAARTARFMLPLMLAASRRYRPGGDPHTARASRRQRDVGSSAQVDNQLTWSRTATPRLPRSRASNSETRCRLPARLSFTAVNIAAGYMAQRAGFAGSQRAVTAAGIWRAQWIGMAARRIAGSRESRADRCLQHPATECKHHRRRLNNR